MNINKINSMSFAGKMRFKQPLKANTIQGTVQEVVFDADSIHRITPCGISAYIDYGAKYKPDKTCEVVKMDRVVGFRKADDQPFTDSEYSSVLAAYTAAKLSERDTIIDINV